MAVKQKVAKHAVKHADPFLPLLGLLLVVVLLLIATPSMCGCHRGGTFAGILGWLSDGMPRNNYPTNPAPIATTTVSYSLSPVSGPIGTIVTIHGSGFSTDNTIEMNGLVSGSMKHVPSPNGKTLSFMVPQSLGPNCKPNEMCAQFLLKVTPNTYKISVETDGVMQDMETFTVTAK